MYVTRTCRNPRIKDFLLDETRRQEDEKEREKEGRRKSDHFKYVSPLHQDVSFILLSIIYINCLLQTNHLDSFNIYKKVGNKETMPQSPSTVE